MHLYYVQNTGRLIEDISRAATFSISATMIGKVSYLPLFSGYQVYLLSLQQVIYHLFVIVANDEVDRVLYFKCYKGGTFLRHPVQLLADRNKMTLRTYFDRIVCLYLAKMYE